MKEQVSSQRFLMVARAVRPSGIVPAAAKRHGDREAGGRLLLLSVLQASAAATVAISACVLNAAGTGICLAAQRYMIS
jgi:hypothetical protein